MFNYIGIFFAGILAGEGLRKLTGIVIRKRTNSPGKYICIEGKAAMLAWPLATGCIWLFLAILHGIQIKTLEYLLVFSTCLVLSVADIRIRKIPNGALITLFCIAAGGLLWKEPLDLPSHLWGCVLGAGVFLLPLLIWKQVGWGDVKFAAVIGFYLGVRYAVLAAFFISILLLLYTGFLWITKKGGLHSAVALGPCMSAGFLVALVLMGHQIGMAC